MKLFALAAIVLVVGCAQRQKPQTPKILIEGNPPRIGDRTQDSTRIIEYRSWYDAEQLDQIVHEYVREKKIDFDFRGTEPQFRIPRARQFLARAEYSSGFGKPVLIATIGWDGHVIEHKLGIAVEAPIGPPAAR